MCAVCCVLCACAQPWGTGGAAAHDICVSWMLLLSRTRKSGRFPCTTTHACFLPPQRQVVDKDGNACSFINSNYMGFGNGLGEKKPPVMSRVLSLRFLLPAFFRYRTHTHTHTHTRIHSLAHSLTLALSLPPVSNFCTVPEGCGFTLQNRGANFVLQEGIVPIHHHNHCP